MKERGDNTVVINIDKTDNVIAYCSDCRSLVFHGNDEIPVRRKILKSRVLEHLNYGNSKHGVDVIYPRKDEPERIIEGYKFASSNNLILGFPKRWFYKYNN